MGFLPQIIQPSRQFIATKWGNAATHGTLDTQKLAANPN